MSRGRKNLLDEAVGLGQAVDLPLGRVHGPVHRPVVAAIGGLSGEQDPQTSVGIRQRMREIDVGDAVLRKKNCRANLAANCICEILYLST